MAWEVAAHTSAPGFNSEADGLADGSHRQRVKAIVRRRKSKAFTAEHAEDAEHSRAEPRGAQGHRAHLDFSFLGELCDLGGETLFLNLFLGFAQRYLDFHLFLAAEDGYVDHVAGAVFVHDLSEVLLVFDFVAVDGDNEIAADHDGHVAEIGTLVAAVQSGAIGGASGNDLNDQQAVVGRQTHLIGEVGVDGNGAYTERGTPHAAQGDEVVENSFGSVDGNGKADAGALADVGGDQGVDADDFAVPVRAAGRRSCRG